MYLNTQNFQRTGTCKSVPVYLYTYTLVLKNIYTCVYIPVYINMFRTYGRTVLRVLGAGPLLRPESLIYR
jgi:hypothetical protein